MAALKVEPQHVIKVLIEDYVLKVLPEVLYMGKGGRKAIRWDIVTEGWKFPDFENGIEVKGGDHGEFSNGRSDDTGTHFTLHNKNSHTRYYPYTVKVTNGATTLYLDPGIGNESDH